MTKQQFINAFINEVRDINRRRNIDPNTTNANQIQIAPPVGYAIPAPAGVNKTVLEDWWRLISNGANPGAAGGRLGRAGAGNRGQAFGAGYFVNPFSVISPWAGNGAGGAYVPVRADRTQMNAGNETWGNCRRDANAGNSRNDDEIAGFLLGKLYNAGWEAQDVNVDEAAFQIILVRPSDNNVMARGINNVIQPAGMGVDISVNAVIPAPGKSWEQIFKDAGINDQEVINAWHDIRFGEQANLINYVNRGEFLNAQEAIDLHKKGWFPGDLNSVGNAAFQVANAIINGAGGNLAANKAAILGLGKKEDEWHRTFNNALTALGTTTITDKNISKEWMNLREAKSQDPANPNTLLAANQKINAVQAARLHNRGWKSYNFNNWNGNLRPLGGRNPINGANIANLAAIIAAFDAGNNNRVNDWRTNFAAGYIAAGGNANDMKGDGSNGSHNIIMDSWLALINPNGKDGGKGIRAGVAGENYLNANLAGQAYYNGWKAEDMSAGTVAANIGQLCTFSPADGITNIYGIQIYNAGNTWKMYYRSNANGFRSAGNPANLKNDTEIDAWIGKISIGIRAGQAFNNGWEANEVDSTGKATIDGEIFYPWRITKQEARRQAREAKKDDDKEKKDPSSSSSSSDAQKANDKWMQEQAKEVVDSHVEQIKNSGLINLTKVDDPKKNAENISKVEAKLKEIEELKENTTEYGGQMSHVLNTHTELKEKEEKLRSVLKELKGEKQPEKPETGGDKTGGDKTGGDKTGGDKTGGDKTGGDKTGGDEKKPAETVTVDSAHKRIHEEMKKHNCKEKNLKNLFKELAKDYPEIKDKKSLQEVLEAVEKSNKAKLSAFQSELIKKIENKTTQTGFTAHMGKNWGWYLGGTALLGAGGFGIYYFTKSKKSADEESENEE